jgi:Highly conserved protein containing a thioredoxin domain
VALPQKNLLVNETSPYLLQHRDNPVHWRPWSAAALHEAKQLDRPILLSIGYAACHWCHVMAHECFEDEQVAEVMNRYFVNIKVDREERPDIDQIYMTSLQAMGDQGGWPLTMFLTPDGKPFWGGTYFPKEPKFGRPGFIEILNAIHQAWQEQRRTLVESADALASHVQNVLSPQKGGKEFQPSALHALANRIGTTMDRERGGMKGAPKFPNVPFLNLLWLDWLEYGTAEHRDMVLTTLRAILSGGIYDHVGGGMSRYSTDDEWLVPHFEKMLYDNAQIISLCCQAYGETGDPLFRVRVEETVKWMLNEMWLAQGGFASSLDADSEGKEGKYYTWTEDELVSVLGKDGAEELLQTYQLSKPATWEGGPILHRSASPNILEEPSERRLHTLKHKLADARKARVRPGCDDKILIDWNGLAINALAEAGRVFSRPEWIEAAQSVYAFIQSTMRDGRLPHSVRGDAMLFPGLSSDYAAMIKASLALYQATWNEDYLVQAEQWAEMLNRWHGDEKGEGYYLTASDSRDVPVRIRGDIDEAIPSPSSQIIEALTKLAIITGNDTLYDKALKAAASASARVETLLYGQVGVVYASAIAQKPHKLMLHDGSGALLAKANRILDPRRVDIRLGSEPAKAEKAAGISVDRRKNAAWLCVGQSCLAPISDPAELRKALL